MIVFGGRASVDAVDDHVFPTPSHVAGHVDVAEADHVNVNVTST